MDQKTGDVGIAAGFGVLVDDALPLDGLLYGVDVDCRAHDDAAFIDISLPRAPLRYILETELNLSCPAMSHNCSRTGLPSTLDFSFVEKSQPMVGRTFSSNLWWTYW